MSIDDEGKAAIEISDVVISLNGRDKGKRFLVAGIEDGLCSLVDGKGRRMEKPKKKKIKHLSREAPINNIIAQKLTDGDKVTNIEVRRALAQYAAILEEGGM